MGIIKQHPKVKIFAAITVTDVKQLPNVLNKMAPTFGNIDSRSDWFNVDSFTQYYQNEMGKELQKVFVSFTDLTIADYLPWLKLSTNILEDKFRQKQNRTVNIDPGYLTEAKVVLATTKDFSHRLYLGQGIFGDLHLVFRDASYRSQELTYPDYRQKLAISFFNQLRPLYKQQITKS